MNCDETARYPHLEVETEAIRAAIGRGMPVLGICLGAQLIARALGARVSRNPQKEIGWYDITLTEAGANFLSGLTETWDDLIHSTSQITQKSKSII